MVASVPAQLNAAGRTRIGLGVKTTMIWVVVFVQTSGTHFKDLHRRLGTVVGNCPLNGIARTALGAGNEWIPKTTVLWVM